MSRIWEALKKAETEKSEEPVVIDDELHFHEVDSGILPEAEREFILILKQVEAALGAIGSLSLALTSPSPGVGTSTVASNLACVAATARGKKVLLVDANLRQEGFGESNALADAPGLAEVLGERTTLSGVVHPTEIPTLSILPSGRVGKRISMLLEAERIGAFIRKAKAEYQYVILDCPPILSSAETMTLSSKCDGTIIVAEWGRTKREVAERAKDILEEAGARLVGITLNKRKYVIPGVIYRLL